MVYLDNLSHCFGGLLLPFIIMCKQFVKSVAFLVNVLVFSCYAYDLLYDCVASLMLWKQTWKHWHFQSKISQREWTVAVCECFGIWDSIQGDSKGNHKLHLKECAKSVCAWCCLERLTYSADCCFICRSLSWSQQHYRFTIFLAASVSFNNIWQSLLDFDWSGSKNRCETLGVCVLLKNHQSIVSSQHLRQIQCLVFQIVVQWHIFHHKLMHIDQEHFTSMELNFLR